MNDTLHKSKNWFQRLSNALLREPQDREQLIDLLHDAKQRELLDNDALNMIEGVLQVSEMKARDIMIPRPQMVMIESDTQAEQALPLIIESRHSRFPIIGENRDEVLGILLAKDLLKLTQKQDNKKNTILKISELARPATFIPESKRLDTLLKEFRLNRNHMAIVIDEYGSIAGLVTIEDVLEQIVGDIVDEFDAQTEEAYVKKIKDNHYSIKALMPMEDFNEYFNTNYEHETFDTIGGLLLQKFSHLPKPGEEIKFDQLTFKVIQASQRGIQLLRLTKSNPSK